MPVWIQLFWGFFKVGILGFGGGPGSLSLIQVVSVDSYHWLDNQGFAEMLAVGNALPGPIATKMAAEIGWQVAGWSGALAALIGIVLPSLIMMLGLYQILILYRSNPYVAGLIRGVKPIVIVLLVLIILDLLPGVFSKSRWVLPALFFAAGLIAIRGFKISPVWVILASMAGGALWMR